MIVTLNKIGISASGNEGREMGLFDPRTLMDSIGLLSSIKSIRLWLGFSVVRLRGVLLGFFLAFLTLLSPSSANAGSSGGASIHSHVTLTYGNNFRAHASIDVKVATRAVAPEVTSDRLNHQAFRGESVDFDFRVFNQSNGLSIFHVRFNETHFDMESGAQVTLLNQQNVEIDSLELAAAFTVQASGANSVAISAGSERGFRSASETTLGSLVRINQAEYRVVGISVGSAAHTSGSGELLPEVPSVLQLEPLNNHPAITVGSLPAGSHVQEFSHLVMRVVASAPSVPGKSGFHRMTLTGSARGVAVIEGDANGAAVDFIVAENLQAEVEVPSPISQLVKRVRNVSRGQSEYVISSRVDAQAYAAPGEILEYEIQVNALAGDLLGVTLNDSLSPFVEYLSGSLLLNGKRVSDEQGAPIFNDPASWQIHSPDAEPGLVRDQQAAVIRYRVSVNINETARRK